MPDNSGRLKPEQEIVINYQQILPPVIYSITSLKVRPWIGTFTYPDSSFISKPVI